MKVTINVAGRGNITKTMAFEQKGFEGEIIEFFLEMKRLGSDLVLSSNAMRVFQRLSL